MARNTLGETAGVGDWVRWEVMFLPSAPSLQAPSGSPIMSRKMDQYGEVTETDGDRVLVRTLAGNDPPVWLEPSHWRPDVPPSRR